MSTSSLMIHHVTLLCCVAYVFMWKGDMVDLRKEGDMVDHEGEGDMMDHEGGG